MAIESGTIANVTLLDMPTPSGNDDSPVPTDTSATKVIHCTGWTMERNAVESTWASNETNGNRRRQTGTKDCTGTITGVYDPARPVEATLAMGDRVQLQLHVTDVKGHQIKVRITGGPSYNGDIEEGTVSKWTVQWGQDDNSPLFNTTLVDANP